MGIIGYGTIGKELAAQSRKRGWKIIGIATRTSGVVSADGKKLGELEEWGQYFSPDSTDVVCLCIPTLDGGETAHNYIQAAVSLGGRIVTCEKGAFGNYFPELEPRLNQIGYRATVGGKIGMAVELRRMMNAEVKEINAVVNATLNYNLDGVAAGRLIEETIEESRRLGYAEPGSARPLDVFNGEIKDISLKAAVLFNAGLGGRFAPLIRASQLPIKFLEQEVFQRLIREAGSRRYVVSFSKEESKGDVIAGFSHSVGEWVISGGFVVKDENPLFRWMNPAGVDNAIAVYEGRFGKIGLIGPGAGAGPTVSSMFRDIEELTKGAA